MWTPLYPVCYADDLSLLLHVRKDSAANDISSFQSSLNELHSLYENLSLTLNVNKTEILLFKTPYSRINPSSRLVVLNQAVIPFTSFAKCLGLTFNDSLIWTSHFESIRKRCYSCIVTLSRLRSIGFPLSVLILLYHSLFEPILTYGIVIWGKTYSCHLKQITVIQNDCIRAILGLSRSSRVSDRLSELGILPLDRLYVYRVGCLMFRQVNRRELSSRFRRDIRPPPPRLMRYYHETDVNIETQRYNYVISAPRHQHALVWNSLPHAVRNIRHFDRFRTALMEYVRNVSGFGLA